ncbi:MAG: 4Fe-4S ferredoxin [Symploca sp. SIO1A3]|nr:4Fe-4S ferredoxin [Symploca sp. SIO1A3]
MTQLYYPLNSLREGNWFKLICGASFQHLPAVRNLTLAYALAGADCIDVAADPAVIEMAQEALQVAGELTTAAQEQGLNLPGKPWLMVSLNDGEDPHFRKAQFNPNLCPADCPRPCETICPAQAIVFQNTNEVSSGVIEQRCYGCGRCLPVCPSQLIYTRSYVSSRSALAQLILETGIDALEIHTQVGHFTDFQLLWKVIAPWVYRLKLIAISCPDDEGLIDYLWALYQLIAPLPCALVWQTDGRPMSGDIGIGTTRATVKLSEKVLAAKLPGYVQLAGGTNHHTVAKLEAAGLLKGKEREVKERGGEEQNASFPIPNSPPYIAGVAYGSYARVLLLPILDELEKLNEQEVAAHMAASPNPSFRHLEKFPTLLWQAVARAYSLVSQLKSSQQLPEAIAFGGNGE